MLEKDIENLIAQHPDEVFPKQDFELIAQQYSIEGKRIDILFRDRLNRKVIIEVKRGILNREASGQIGEYYGLLKSKNQTEFYEMILCANVIPKERRLFLESIGIECKELRISFILELAEKYNYTFIDDQSSFDSPSISSIDKVVSPVNSIDDENQDRCVWIFQANPEKYDILNALSDKEMGNNIHWLVNQHIKRIKKGHLCFIWMSGEDAGIYALTRIESNPSFKKELEAEKKYWLISTEEKSRRVELTVLRRFINRPILRKTLKGISGLENLSILKQPQGTNFEVRNSEWKIISQLL
tara:strand:+ start:264 stop:1160 length:897 start_codon:yes stop_codon:yes gene_type:complete